MTCVRRGSLAFTFNRFADTNPIPVIYLSAIDGTLITASEGTIIAGYADNLDDDSILTSFARVYTSCPMVEVADLGAGGPVGGTAPRGNGDRWYILRFSLTFHTFIDAIDTDGSVIQTWDLGTILGDNPMVSGGFTHPTTIAVDRDNTIAYLTYVSGANATLAQQQSIQRYDLIGSAFLSDLTSDITFVTEPNSERALLVQRNGNILSTWRTEPAGPTEIRHHAPDGTLLHTYPLDSGADSGSLALDLTDRTFWVHHNLPSAAGVESYATRIRISDGTRLKDFALTTVQKAAIDTAYGTQWLSGFGFYITQTDCGCCPDPCADLGLGEPILALLPECRDIFFLDAALAVIASTDIDGTATGGGGTPDGPCTATTGPSVDCPAWFTAALTGAGATDCYDPDILAAIETTANANDYTLQRNSGCEIRGRMYKGGHPWITECGQLVATSFGSYVDVRRASDGGWGWDAHGGA